MADLPKVFAGNLGFDVTEEHLTELFNQVAPVVKVQLIKRQGRSKGYGFISFNTEKEVTDAVAKFQGYDLDGRLMNCEIARPQVKGEGEVKPRKKRPQKKPQEAKPETKPETQKEPKKEKPVEKKPPQEKKPAPKPVERKERKPRDPGSVSETMIFVGNLPFKVTDEDLKQMFAEYSLKSARIVKGKFGRSKGFGFVDFASPADQKKAINDFSEATINERQLAVKAAYAEQAEE